MLCEAADGVMQRGPRLDVAYMWSMCTASVAA